MHFMAAWFAVEIAPAEVSVWNFKVRPKAPFIPILPAQFSVKKVAVEAFRDLCLDREIRWIRFEILR